MTKFINTMIVLAGLVSSAAAAEQPSMGQGMELFSSTALGTNGKSCSSCHAGGKGLKNVVGLDDADLSRIINQCIQKPLKGKALAPDSIELKSLSMYLRSLSNAGDK